MTVKEIIERAGLGIRVIEDHYDSTVKPPFAAVIHGKRQKICADDKPYITVEEIDIELYTDKYRNEELIRKIEKALEDNGFICETEEDYIAEEKLYRVTFSIEEMITNA